MKFRENVSLVQYSNYKIGGNARFFFEPKNERELAWATREARAEKLSIFILGGGTNLLLDDAGFDGLVIKPALNSIQSKGVSVTVDSGVLMENLLTYTLTNLLTGLEWAGGLPGTLGGAVRGNAGCFGSEMKDVIFSVRSFDLKKMKVVERTAKQCAFGYRDSIFKHGSAGEVILSATLGLVNGERKKIKEAIQEKIAHRKKNHPLEYSNIGSIFKNVPLASLTNDEWRMANDETKKGIIIFRGSQFSVKVDPFPVISAAKLISESGLRGVSMGGAMISAKHPNFIVNVLDASSEDVKSLMALAKAEVLKKFGVELEEEVQIV